MFRARSNAHSAFWAKRPLTSRLSLTRDTVSKTWQARQCIMTPTAHNKPGREKDMRSALLFLSLAVVLIGVDAVWGEEKKEAEAFDQIGTLQTGVMAIGGETTGTILDTGKGSYELEVEGELAKKASGLNGKKVHVTGKLTVKQGVEVKERRIVNVKTLEEVPRK